MAVVRGTSWNWMSGMLATGTAGALVSAGAAVSLPAAFMAGALLSATAGDGLGMLAFAAAGALVADSVGGIWLVPASLVWDKAVCRRTSPPNRTAIISFFITLVCFSFNCSNFFFALELE